MSFFSDSVVIGDTSSPTTYELSGTLDPNASQYGWTKSDQAHYNQLTSYVNDAKRYYEHAVVIGEFIKEAMKEIDRIEKLTIYMNDVQAAVDNDAEQIRLNTEQAFIYHREITTIHTQIKAALSDIVRMHGEIVVIGQDAQTAADNARVDSTNAGDYYLRTKKMYDEWKATQP